MMNLIKKLVKDESGQDLAEYGIALGVIAVGVAVTAGLIATRVDAIWTAANTALNAPGA